MSVAEILNYNLSKESFFSVLSCGTVYYGVQGGFNFLSLWMKWFSVLNVHTYRCKNSFQDLDHNKQYHRKELLMSSFHLNSQTLGFQPRSQKLEQLNHWLFYKSLCLGIFILWRRLIKPILCLTTHLNSFIVSFKTHQFILRKNSSFPT